MKKKRFNKRVIKENLQLGTMALPAMVIYALFSYLPMFGVLLAFKNYKVGKGILGSDWAKPLFKNFRFFWSHRMLFV